ncbi:MAG TPA: hypothetical protein VMX94_04100 [Armatimonadota bacterium]|nr:hypothetical protein [Armatimonadota bacterium]
MGGSKLRTVHVVFIGSFACVLVIVGLYLLVIKNSYKEIASLNARYQTAEQKWMQKASVEAKLAAAKMNNRVVTARYEQYLRTKMPSISFQDRTQGMIALWKEQGETLGPLLQSWPAKTGVKLATDVQVPPAPANPNDIDGTFISIPIGAFSVKGDFRTILAHLQSWNGFNRLVQIDPAVLSGTSPRMTAEYTVTVYIFPRGEAGPAIPMAAGTAEAGLGAVPGMAAPVPPPAR